ncbi:MAG: hypothetical protein K0R59_2024 [Sphingobacterium sp.]|jgi:hypothetical protein|nr:hypothetical protein [Sphingobacterium sp.]
MNWKYFIGIDVSKATLDVCILEGKDKRHSIEIENKPKALTAFWKFYLLCAKNAQGKL